MDIMIYQKEIGGIRQEFRRKISVRPCVCMHVPPVESRAPGFLAILAKRTALTGRPFPTPPTALPRS
ncbi:hypothetical protein [uncultured Alistipes sp.]|jgi:hypothetical protein|uniref:hypothetical protein n=1 Tax=uncultured Alistipes sp. TaxID=538949 RepID=UPI00272ACB65|nr:hypothetical protein [uncultured Alistipes sp.]